MAQVTRKRGNAYGRAGYFFWKESKSKLLFNSYHVISQKKHTRTLA